ncbi:MAG: HlyD family efflux transporter periplasmic adaptor subunit [Caldilineaceae bacterium]|nr:HlyD family efflux transporter periplasmic adaptor subunit [Caldilineaceae bacterium]
MLRTISRIIVVLSLAALVAAGVALYRNGLPELAGAPADIQTGQASTTEPLAFFGALQVAEPRQVVAAAGGQVTSLLVEEGDSVTAGQELLRLDTTNLDTGIEKAEIGLDLAKIALAQLGEGSKESELATAKANVDVAKINLEKLKEGPTKSEITAAQNSTNAAWARYNELKAGPSQARIDQLRANMDKAQIALTEAQRNYDEIAWRPDIGKTPQSAALQRATIDFTAVKAAFDEATAPAKQSDLLTALTAAQRAQISQDDLLEGATDADIALAEARVLSAQAALDRLEELAGASDLAAGELRVRQAEIGLEEAKAAKARAKVTAPIAGVVTSLNVSLGQMIGAGSSVAVVGDVAALKLVVNVPQDDIDRVSVGASVTVTRYGTDKTVDATVKRIAPVGTPGAGTATFPVTIMLPTEGADGFSPGMLVSVSFDEASE